MELIIINVGLDLGCNFEECVYDAGHHGDREHNRYNARAEPLAAPARGQSLRK